MGLIIEVVNRAQKVLERHRFSGSRITLGRGYDNDLILTDPHVSPQHAIFETLESGEWVIKDCSSRNGVFSVGHKRIEGVYFVRSGDIFTLGRSQVRVYASDHLVEETLPLNPVDALIAMAGRPWVAIATVACLLLMVGIQQYLATFTQLEVKSFVSNLSVILLGALGWVSIWALVGRITRHDMRFFAQTTIIAFYVVVGLIWQHAFEVLAYAMNSKLLGSIGSAVGTWGLLSGLLWMNFYMATAFGRYARLWLSTTGAFLVVAASVFPAIYKGGAFLSAPVYDGTVMPPAFYLGTSITVEKFLSDSAAIFPELEP